MAFTRKTIRQRLLTAEFCGDGFASTATATGSSTTLVDTSKKQPDDFFIGAQVQMLEIAGVAATDLREVTDWVQSTSTFTVDRAMSGTPVSADDYEVHRIFSVTDKNNAIAGAQYAGQLRYPYRIENTQRTFTANTYTYSLNSLTVEMDPDLGIDEVWYDTGASGTGTPYAKLDDDLWSVRTSGTTYTLQVLMVPRNNATIRLVYRVRPTVVSSDATSIVPDSTAYQNYLCAKAAAILFRNRAMREPAADWTDRANAMEQQAELFWNEDKPQPREGKVRLPTWGNEQRSVDYFPTDFGL